MFTSINRLRNSTAIQDRVTRVENFLKKNSAVYTPDMLFPAAVIIKSNNLDDYDWVMRNAFLNGTGFVGGKPIDLSRLNNPAISVSGKARLANIEAQISTLIGGTFKWTDGIWPTAKQEEQARAAATKPSDAPVSASSRWPFPTGNRPDGTPTGKTKTKKETKATAKKATKAKPVKEPKAKAAKPVKLNWLTTALPAKSAKVSTGEAAKQRKAVSAALSSLILSGRVEGGLVKGKKTTVYTIVL